MLFYTKYETTIVSAKSCDRCHYRAEKHDSEFHEFLSIERQAGFGSAFGDGNHLKLDLCQHCMKELLSPWLSVSERDSF